MQQPIYAYSVGNIKAAKRILVTGGMHAREWITAFAVFELIKIYDSKYKNGEFEGHIIFVPLCNPDGVRLALDGLNDFWDKRKEFLLRANKDRQDFSLWKANANAVDLNVNFNADWGKGSQNVFSPASANYVGECPESEPETRALVRLVKNFRPTYGLAFHSKGEVIYYSRETDEDKACGLGKITGYRPILSRNSAGGLTDFLAWEMNIPSFTIEVGDDNLTHPIGKSQLPRIMGQITDAISYLLLD
jgi:g-D-glutamyl-meso-diaminopimelate peptidase